MPAVNRAAYKPVTTICPDCGTDAVETGLYVALGSPTGTWYFGTDISTHLRARRLSVAHINDTGSNRHFGPSYGGPWSPNHTICPECGHMHSYV